MQALYPSKLLNNDRINPSNTNTLRQLMIFHSFYARFADDKKIKYKNRKQSVQNIKPSVFKLIYTEHRTFT
ncbi:hypothetical protein BpHYR1_025043 [Brachionus plicatilis]|uniref:Uncharacterized protein n=1 Tax=Brachionus plicatilis TaxID=10195 RepID=A0A3M7RPS1_BRAPC|nr:hypothetical protein BpHYR1_025043 [Brachionus plicatilis]